MHSYALYMQDACTVLIVIEFQEIILLNVIYNINILNLLKIHLSYLLSKLMITPPNFFCPADEDQMHDRLKTSLIIVCF